MMRKRKLRRVAMARKVSPQSIIVSNWPPTIWNRLSSSRGLSAIAELLVVLVFISFSLNHFYLIQYVCLKLVHRSQHNKCLYCNCSHRHDRLSLSNVQIRPNTWIRFILVHENFVWDKLAFRMICSCDYDVMRRASHTQRKFCQHRFERQVMPVSLVWL